MGKLVVKRRKNGQNGGQDVRAALDCIKHHVWISGNIEVQEVEPGYEIYTIDVQHQPAVEGVNFDQAIRNAIASKDNLEILSLEPPPLIVMRQGVVVMEQSADKTTYEFLLECVRLLAKNPDIRQSCLHSIKPIVELRFEFRRQLGQLNSDIYTGCYGVTRASAGQPFQEQNPYAKLARLMNDNPRIEHDVLAEEILRLELTVEANGTLSVQIRYAQQKAASAAAANP